MPNAPWSGPLLKSTDTQCLGYATFNWYTSWVKFKYYWIDVSCDTKAPFVCTNNPGLDRSGRLWCDFP